MSTLNRKKNKGIVTETVTLVGKCILCNKKQVLTEMQIANAKETGAAMSTCCYFPMTIEGATRTLKIRK